MIKLIRLKRARHLYLCFVFSIQLQKDYIVYVGNVCFNIDKHLYGTWLSHTI